MTDAERQIQYLTERFATLMGIDPSRITIDTDDERLCVSWWRTADEVRDFFLMEIGSDDDRYRFELWRDGRDTGTYVEFAFEGETL